MIILICIRAFVGIKTFSFMKKLLLYKVARTAIYAQQKGQKGTEEHGRAKHKLHIFLLPLTSVIQP